MCFNAVRADGGSFRFGADEPAPWRCPEPVELSDALVEVERLLKQWREVVRCIPSLDCRARLLDALVVDELVLDRDRWSLLVALDGRRTVRDVVERVGRPTLEVCQALLELVDAGAVGIIEPETVAVEPVAAARRPSPSPSFPWSARPNPFAPRNRRRSSTRPNRSDRNPYPPPSSGPRSSRRPSPRPRHASSRGLLPNRGLLRSRPRRSPRPSRPATAGADRGTFLRMFSGLRDA